MEDVLADVHGAKSVGATIDDALATLDIIGKAYAS